MLNLLVYKFVVHALVYIGWTSSMAEMGTSWIRCLKFGGLTGSGADSESIFSNSVYLWQKLDNEQRIIMVTR